MNKMKEFLLSMDKTLSILVLIGLRASIFGAGIGDALAIGFICAHQAFIKWNDNNLLLKKQQPLNEKVEKDLQDIRASMSGMMIKNSIRPTVNTSNEPIVPIKFF
jgi:hypothetical protein